MTEERKIQEFLISTNVHRLVDDALCHLYEVQPPTPKDVFDEFIAGLHAARTAFYDQARAQFEATLRFLESDGLKGSPSPDPTADASLVSLDALRFAIPLADGSVFELFPHGAQVAVTPASLGHFRGLLKVVRQACQAVRQDLVEHPSRPPSAAASSNLILHTPDDIRDRLPVTVLAEYLRAPDICNTYYVPNTHIYLPLSPDIYRLTDPCPRGTRSRNFAAVLEMMLTVTGDVRSPWYLRRSRYITDSPVRPKEPKFATAEELWAIYDVMEVVFFHETAFPVEYDHAPAPLAAPSVGLEGRRPGLVSLADAPAYAQAALATLSTLQTQEASGLPLTGKRSSLTTTGGSSSGSTSLRDARTEQSPPLVETLGYEVGPLERQFWEQLDAIKRDPERNFPKKKMSFVLSLPGGPVVLKVNGEFIDVTRHNLGMFIDAILENKDEIHRKFGEHGAGGVGGSAEKGSGTLVATPPAGSKRSTTTPLSRRHLRTGNNAVERTPSDGYPGTPSSSLQSGGAYVSSLEKFPVNVSRQWNSFSITADDVMGQAYVDLIVNLENDFDNGQLGDEQLARERFYIPTKRGPYELIPNGKQIPVTRASAKEYFSRIRAELAKLEGQRAAWDTPTAAASSRAPGIGQQTDSPPAGVQSPRRFSPPSLPQYRQPPLSAPHTLPQASNTGAVLSPSPPQLHTPHQRAVLDDRDLLFLREFAGHVESLRRHPTRQAALRETQLNFSIYFPEKRVTVELTPNGAHIPVTMENFEEFCELFESTRDEIVQELLAKRRYPVPPSHLAKLTVSADRRRPEVEGVVAGARSPMPNVTTTGSSNASPRHQADPAARPNRTFMSPKNDSLPKPFAR